MFHSLIINIYTFMQNQKTLIQLLPTDEPVHKKISCQNLKQYADQVQDILRLLCDQAYIYPQTDISCQTIENFSQQGYHCKRRKYQHVIRGYPIHRQDLQNEERAIYYPQSNAIDRKLREIVIQSRAALRVGIDIQWSYVSRTFNRLEQEFERLQHQSLLGSQQSKEESNSC